MFYFNDYKVYTFGLESDVNAKTIEELFGEITKANYKCWYRRNTKLNIEELWVEVNETTHKRLAFKGTDNVWVLD